MYKRGVVFLLVLMLVFVSLHTVSAVDTRVKIVTYANHDLIVDFFKTPPGIELYQTFNVKSNSEGVADMVFSTEKSQFNVGVFVMEDGEKVTSAKFEELTPGIPIELRVFNGESEAIENFDKVEATTNDTLNETANETATNETANKTSAPQNTDVVNQVSTSTPGITRKATDNNSGETSFFSNTSIYFIIGLLVLGVVVYTGMLKLKTVKKEDYGNESEQKTIKVKKLSDKLKEMKEEKQTNKNHYSTAIEEAEEKIKQAQKDLDKLKNTERIESIKKKIEEQKKELEELEGKD